MKEEMRKETPKVSLGDQLHSQEESAFERYKMKAAGDLSLGGFILFEIFNLLFAGLGGAAGYVSRKWLLRRLFKHMGRGLIIGRGAVIRHPGRISIGDNVAIDDNVFLDAAGSGESGVTIGDGVLISRNCVVQGKLGPLELEDRVDVGAHCVFSAIAGIRVGKGVIIAGNCYIGGARYHNDRLDIPIMDQGRYSRGPVSIGKNSWIGAGAIILDGVSVGEGVIVGAGAVVTKDIPDFAIVAGVPAKIIRMRAEKV